jgi:hypothetical protein
MTTGKKSATAIATAATDATSRQGLGRRAGAVTTAQVDPAGAEAAARIRSVRSTDGGGV